VLRTTLETALGTVTDTLTGTLCGLYRNIFADIVPVAPLRWNISRYSSLATSASTLTTDSNRTVGFSYDVIMN